MASQAVPSVALTIRNTPGATPQQSDPPAQSWWQKLPQMPWSRNAAPGAALQAAPASPPWYRRCPESLWGCTAIGGTAGELAAWVVPAVAGEPVTWSIITLRIACGGLMVLGGGAFAQTYIWRPYRDLDKEEKALRVDLETERKLDAQESTNVQQLRAELKESQAQLQARQAEVTSMERVLQDTQARLKEIQGALAQTKAVQQAQDGLQKRLDDSGAVLAADLRGLNSVSHDLGAQLTVLREQVSAVDRADRAASTELAQLRSQVEQYEKSITALREAMEKQQAGYEALMNGQRAATAASQSVAATAHAIDGDRQRMEQLEHEVHDSLLPLGEVQALTAQLRSLVDSAKKDA